MSSGAPVNWYLYGAGLALAAVSYVLIARAVVDLLFGSRGDNALFRGLRWVSAPFVAAARSITPRIVPGALVSTCALLWIFAARIALVQVAAALTMRRTLG
jgi:uncharacterized protein YggT (Ycf19 family)